MISYVSIGRSVTAKEMPILSDGYPVTTSQHNSVTLKQTSDNIKIVKTTPMQPSKLTEHFIRVSSRHAFNEYRHCQAMDKVRVTIQSYNDFYI